MIAQTEDHAAAGVAVAAGETAAPDAEELYVGDFAEEVAVINCPFVGGDAVDGEVAPVELAGAAVVVVVAAEGEDEEQVLVADYAALEENCPFGAEPKVQSDC